MIVYFDREGNLKEIINDLKIVGSSGVNKVFSIWEGEQKVEAQYGYITFTDAENNIVAPIDQVMTKQANYVLTPDRNRDLKFLSYSGKYTARWLTIPDGALAHEGQASFTIRYQYVENGSTKIQTMQQVNFMVQESNVELHKPDEIISIADYNYLLKLISSGGVIIDDELSLGSENPVQNKVITRALSEIVIEDSDNIVHNEDGTFTLIMSHKCDNSGDTPAGATWIKATQDGNVEITGTLEASYDTLGMIYCCQSAGETECSMYLTLRWYSDGLGDFTYQWRKINNVLSVNGKTGKVVLSANDILTDDNTTIQENIERIDSEMEDLTPDASLSSVSENPVQNKVIKAALDGKQKNLIAGRGITIDANGTISAEGTQYIHSTTAANTPTLAGGSLEASADTTGYVYLVGDSESGFDQYITIKNGVSTYSWLYLGQTGSVDLSGKLDKITTGTGTRVYAHAGGTQKDIPIESGAGSLVARDVDNKIQVGDPTNNYDAANKKYVDEKVKVNSVNSKTGEVVLNAGDIKASNLQTIQQNLERIDERIDDILPSNTLPAENPNSPVTSYAIIQALTQLDGAKVDKLPGKSLSSNDFTDLEKEKLESIPEQDGFIKYNSNLGGYASVDINPEEKMYYEITADVDETGLCAFTTPDYIDPLAPIYIGSTYEYYAEFVPLYADGSGYSRNKSVLGSNAFRIGNYGLNGSNKNHTIYFLELTSQTIKIKYKKLDFRVDIPSE